MKPLSLVRVSFAIALVRATCVASNNPNSATVETTSSTIAIENLDQQIAQSRDDVGVEELLLVRSRFLADFDSLDRACSLAEGRFATGRELLLRAKTRSAVHRFADALADLDAAERRGARTDEIAASRASIFVATGRAAEAIPILEFALVQRPGFGSRSALAAAYAAAGRFDDADHLYAKAIADLDTTLPFPYAWIYFARGLMWSEQAGNPSRGATFYARSLQYLPEFVTGNIHLAEIEAAHGDLTSAISRLESIVSANEPEAVSLLGELYVRRGDALRGRNLISRAAQRFDSLLAHHLLAFADHAARFYLGPGANSERGWELARQNLANRETPTSFALAIIAAEATGRRSESAGLTATAQAKFGLSLMRNSSMANNLFNFRPNN
jgi:Flp pilus assembly protein TadD